MVDDEVETNEAEDEGPPTPLCLRCLKPVDPAAHYCPNCGNATGQLTPYMPFESIPWYTGIWGQMWRQLGSPRVSVLGWFLRLLMIVLNAPVLLIGLFFRRRDAGSGKLRRS
ncbi:MAG: hypothetical protein GX448_12920 [Planctomycetes bacterium]|nr:hypothetical protein [Planctomycetota bacterium]